MSPRIFSSLTPKKTPQKFDFMYRKLHFIKIESQIICLALDWKTVEEPESNLDKQVGCPSERRKYSQLLVYVC